ncbi:MAG: hypothetical protein KCHDKBKB_03037 [Elusimicrobia bacterium]|nr:hypothetical protein [Elusimicrobiota bacterium]
MKLMTFIRRMLGGLDSHESRLEEETFGVEKNADELSFAEAFDEFYASQIARNLRESTLSHCRNFGRRAKAALGDIALRDISTALCDRLRTHKGNSFAEELRVFLNWAVRRRLLAVCPMPVAPPPPRTDNPAPTYLRVADAHALYHAMEEEFKPALALALWAGLRPFEIARMDWSCIHLADRRLRIDGCMTKVRRPRVIDGVPTILWAQLALYHRGSGPFVPGVTTLTRYQFWAEAKSRAMKRAGLKLPKNVLRHTFATYFTALTGNPAVTARVLGHTKLDLLVRHYDGLASQTEAMDYFHPRPVLALPEHRTP